MQIDPLGLLALAALAAGLLWHHHRSRQDPADHDSRAHPERPDGEGQALIGPAATEPRLRALDVVELRCEHLTHPAADIPTARITRAASARDHRELTRLGWGSDHHTTLCRYHNPDARPLDQIHVLCHTPGCGERDALRADRDLDSEIGRLRQRGWHNDQHNRQLCPYCTGARRRPRW